MDKESLYEEHIKPLMDRVFDLCKEHGIPFIASFEMSEKVIVGAYMLSGSVTDQLRLAALIMEDNISVSVVPVKASKQPVQLHD